MASTSGTSGAELVGVEDAGTYFTGSTVETVLQEIGSTLNTENLWDRTSTTISPHNANDNLDLGSGAFSTTGLATIGSAKLKYDGSNYADITIGATGGVTLNATGVDASWGFSDLVRFNDNTQLYSDTKKHFLGAGNDMTIWYDGTNGNIKTSDVAASDLHVQCGTDKTLILDESVYEDIQFPVSSGKAPAANYPTYEVFTTNTEEYAFSVDDKIQLQANEPPHGWVEGTVGSAHVHMALKTAQSTGEDRYVKLELIFAYADYNGIWTEQAAITKEETIPTGSAALQSFLVGFTSTVTLTGLHVGSQIKCRVRRIAATGGTEYADDVYITQVGVHVQQDTLGSRTLSAK